MAKIPVHMSGNNKILVLSFLLVVSSAFLVWRQFKIIDLQKQVNSYASNPSQFAEKEKNRITDKISKFYALPKLKQKDGAGKETEKVENLAVYRIKETDSYKGLAFYKDARSGDYVLIFQQNKLAFIYRESENRLINIGPMDLNAPQLPRIRIIGKQNDRDAVEKKLSNKYPNAAFYAKSDAKGTYTSTIVVDPTGNSPKGIEQLTSVLTSAVSGKLPDTEDKVDGFDVIIIAGPQP